MKDKNYIASINILFVVVMFLGYFYFLYLISFTPFLKQEKDNALIPLIITFLFGVAIKSFYAFFMTSMIEKYGEVKTWYHLVTKAIDFITGLMFLSYISRVLHNHYFTPLIILIGITFLIAIVLLNWNAIKTLLALKRK